MVKSTQKLVVMSRPKQGLRCDSRGAKTSLGQTLLPPLVTDTGDTTEEATKTDDDPHLQTSSGQRAASEPSVEKGTKGDGHNWGPSPKFM